MHTFDMTCTHNCENNRIWVSYLNLFEVFGHIFVAVVYKGFVNRGVANFKRSHELFYKMSGRHFSQIKPLESKFFDLTLGSNKAFNGVSEKAAFFSPGEGFGEIFECSLDRLINKGDFKIETLRF